ncbi:Cell shape-determining protein MreC [Candidatus Desulfarcum epimagneticum]|uniref:Cell shape-determining protein MreC n=1 Tax=uncultured Desulfobacteraceae bacterium TaxID=218296 RepID=A0A484HGW7_9BACT|nr:Cell shape-determining protein MreC [uncultured Desulfobacteraceae bacterium]
MFSKKTLMIAGVTVLIVVNIAVLSVRGPRQNAGHGLGRATMWLIAPLQEAVTRLTHFAKNFWTDYFYLISVSEENRELKSALEKRVEKNNRCVEIEMTNSRLRGLLNFRNSLPSHVAAAEVIGRDPSRWFKTIVIDKGEADGVRKGLPVIVSGDIAGQVSEVSSRYSKVLLITDPNSAVDAMIQRNRARGVIKGEATGQCRLEYALRKNEIRKGDIVISSGIDGVFPKGLRIGYVSEVSKPDFGIFQKAVVVPYVDFERLEEALVLLSPNQKDWSGGKLK